MNNSLLAVKWVESFLHIDCMDISLENDVNSSKPLFVVLLLLLILISVLLLSDYQLTAAEQTKNELSNKNKTILELIAKENSCQWGLIVFVSILISAFPIKIGCCFFNSSVIFQFFCLSHSNADSFFAENKYVLWISVQSSYRNKKPLFKFFVSWIRCYVAMYLCVRACVYKSVFVFSRSPSKSSILWRISYDFGKKSIEKKPFK